MESFVRRLCFQIISLLFFALHPAPLWAQTLNVLQNMSFGEFAPDASGGSVSIDVDGTPSYNGIIDLGGTKSEARLQATGTPLVAFSLDLPNDPSTLVNGSETMTLGGFVHNAPGSFDGGGSADFSLGATLTMNPNQVPGNYTANLDIGINYE